MRRWAVHLSLREGPGARLTRATRRSARTDEWQVSDRRYLSEASMDQLTPPAPTSITATANKPEVIDTAALRARVS